MRSILAVALVVVVGYAAWSRRRRPYRYPKPVLYYDGPNQPQIMD